MVSKSHLLKAKQVEELALQIKNSKTLMIVSIKGLPSKQFQDIKKSIRDEVDIIVAKKNILIRTIKSLNQDSILELEKYIQDNCAFAFSNTQGYELAGLLSKKKTPVYAKAGQEAPEDIEIKDGPTDLMPGPAISELGALGLKVSVEDGKIAIKQSKIVVNKGQTINENAASIFQKLNIMPFTIGLTPIAIYETESNKIYTDINIDPQETKVKLIDAATKAQGFAQKITYFTKETINYFLSKANTNALSLEKFSKLEDKETQEKDEKKKENPSEEIKTEEKNNDYNSKPTLDEKTDNINKEDKPLKKIDTENKEQPNKEK